MCLFFNLQRVTISCIGQEAENCYKELFIRGRKFIKIQQSDHYEQKKKKNWMTSLLREPATAFSWGPLIILTEALALDQEDAAAEEPAELLVVVEIFRKTGDSRSSAHN